MEKFIVDNFRMFAHVRLGQVLGYAQVDTGANPSFIRQSFAKGFHKIGLGKIKGALRIAAVEQCKLPIVTFLGHDFADVLANIQPDEAGDFQSLPFQVVMTVGVDILYQKPLYLDFGSEQIGFLETALPKGIIDPQVVDLRFTSGLAFFTLGVGPHNLSAIFDTGAGYSVLNARCFDRLRAELIELRPEETSDPTGATTVIPVYKHSYLAINDYPIGETQFLVIDLTEVENAIGVEMDFIFGFDTMRNYNWIVDKQGNRLLLFSPTQIRAG